MIESAINNIRMEAIQQAKGMQRFYTVKEAAKDLFTMLQVARHAPVIIETGNGHTDQDLVLMPRCYHDLLVKARHLIDLEDFFGENKQ